MVKVCRDGDAGEADQPRTELVGPGNAHLAESVGILAKVHVHGRDNKWGNPTWSVRWIRTSVLGVDAPILVHLNTLPHLELL